MAPAPLEVLAPHVTAVRLAAEAAMVRRLNAGYGFADARIPGQVYLRDDDARERLGRSALRPVDTHAEQEQELSRALKDAAAALAGHASPLTDVGERFGLDPVERALLAAAVAYDLDADVRDLCHALSGVRRRAGLWADVCAELAPGLADPARLLRALHPNGTLRGSCLVSVTVEHGDPRDAKLTCVIGAHRRLLDWLLGDDRIAAPLHLAARFYPRDQSPRVHLADEVRAQIARIAGLLQGGDRASRGAPPIVLIQGAQGAGKLAAAHALAAALGRPLFAAPLPELVELDQRAGDGSLVRQALAEARLRGAVAYLPGIDALDGAGDDGRRLDRGAVEAVAELDDLVILGWRGRGMPAVPGQRPFHLVRLPLADLATRREAWERGLADLPERDALEPDAAVTLASRYVIGPGAIAEVLADAGAVARASAAPLRRAGIEEAVGRRLSLRLGAFGTLITRRARFDEMVLPEDVVDLLGDMIAMVRERSQILEGWGYARHLGLSRGVSALFSGVPGTGKTMAASVISSELGLELIRIDLSAVVSKYVGETEKHLAKIFDEAQNANAMLLFDEADSLFAKRTDVKSAQDRYGNLEVNYILQRMESFDGVSVLTTNLEGSIDQAFVRRLNFRIRFPEPDAEERAELWRKLLPPDTGLTEHIDFGALAERFEMTGGHIRNAIVRAAVIAARANRMMRPEDLLAGAHHEYLELGKVMPSLVG